jgi:UDP-glucose 4-epimerase
MKYVLITGVAGLIGSRMADWINVNKPEYTVIGIDNLFGGYIENINENVIFFRRDLSNCNLDNIFEKYNIEYVFHFAAYAAEGLSPFMRKFNWENNVISTANIINACIKYKVKRLVYTSSMSVYGPGIPGQRFTEMIQPNPQDPYAISKYACEMDIISAGNTHNLDWCIIRPHNVYGIKQNIWDKYRNVLGIWMYQKLNGKSLTIYGDGEQTRAFSYIDDCLEPLWNAAILPETLKEIINLGGTIPFSINDACEVLLKVIGNTPIEHLEPRYEIKHAIPSYKKSIDLLKYKETTSLEEGLREMWEWAKTQPNRKQYIWENYEITDNLYSYWKK